MSLNIRLGFSSIWVAILELLVFAVFSWLYFAVPIWIAADKAVPIWLWIVLGLVYLLIITIWWAPGQQQANDAELHALAIVLGLALLVGGIYLQRQYGIVSDLAKTFWEIMATQGRPNG